MNIIFLDPSKDRRDEIKAVMTGVKAVSSIAPCMDAIQNAEEVSILFLGDVDDIQRLIDWIIEHQPIIRNIIFHADEDNGAVLQLKQASYKITHVPFDKMTTNLAQAKGL